MRLAVMQPYFFPYLGYFALAAAVDRFIFLDDVHYTPQGWINRNRWWVAGAPAYFTVPVNGAGEHTPIDGVHVQSRGPWRRKLTLTLAQAYAKAPQLDRARALLCEVLDAGDEGIAGLAKRSVRATCRELGLSPHFIDSSRGYGNAHLRGEDRVLDLCRREGASEYVNLPGGVALYAPARFAAIGVRLRFVAPWRQAWARGGLPLDPSLSVLDALAFHPAPAVRAWIDAAVAP